ncbi:uncharacterized protein PpBr36_09953 [Pyricularia pennisetigena]|uniref:uncharacterized protein n=1 Tax=Pyricularia pennisetigena TaxID=1578925 RepID=UPI001154C188|nr:uncharacterized protein PpBr36_09953 [Pyricularia pennisetigena]TLS22552.1 hypothetical protein PpBr36_09953 [Pyricularia pennisetigena]
MHHPYTRLAFYAIFVGTGLAQRDITQCPTAETTIQDSQGRPWAVCANSDFIGDSVQILANVQTDQACQKLCASNGACTMAVFDKMYFYCHIKGAGQRWVTSDNSQFNSIRVLAAVPDRQPIDRCPKAETNTTDSQGRTWTTCPNSDFLGPTIQITPNVASSAACQELCAANSACNRAVWDRLGYCHTKGAGQEWVSSANKFDTVRLASDASGGGGGSGSSSSNTNSNDNNNNNNNNNSGQIPSDWRCNGQQTVVTTSDGSTWAQCTNTDWQGRSMYALDNFKSAAACAEACSITPTCKDAVWDKQYNYCHMKDSKAGLVQADNKQFDQLRLIKRAAPATQPAQVGGRWSDRISYPVVPAAAYVVPQQPFASRVLAFSAGDNMAFAGRNGQTQFADWNYQTGAVSGRTVQETKHDMFCPGISSLADGRMVVTGGNDAAAVSIYDPSTNRFVRAPDMKLARGYQSSTTLSNGRVFTIGGSFTGGVKTKNGEVYDPSSNKWTLLDGCKADALNTPDNNWRRDNHAWLYGWTGGSVFQAGPSGQMNWYSTDNGGGGGTRSAGVRNSTGAAMCGTNVMYDTGKILAAGGSPLYDNDAGVTTAQIINVPAPGQTATTQKAPDMKYPRAFANSVVLPDGSVLVTGGQKFARQFTDVESILYPELWSPKTNTWTVVNPMAVPRNYHSVSLLLGDGRVWAAGGGLCWVNRGAADNAANWQCEASAQHADGEIFSPPYLFNADGSEAARPNITALTTSNDGNGNWVRAGGSLTVTLDDSGPMTFSVLRLGSATHSINSDQRRLSLTSTQKGAKHTIRLPSDGGVLLPGYWFLFAMNAQGTPCVARVIQVRLRQPITMEPTQGASALLALAEAIRETKPHEVDYFDTIREYYTICSSTCANDKILEQSSKDLLKRAGLLGPHNSNHDTYMITIHTNAVGGAEDIMLCLEGLFNVVDGWIVINHLNTSMEFPVQDDRANVSTAALFGYVWSRLACKKGKGMGVSPLKAVIFEKLSDYSSPENLSMLRCLSDTQGALLNTLNLSSGQDFLGELSGPVKFEHLFKDGGVCRVLSDALTAAQSVFSNRYPTELLWSRDSTTGYYSLLVLLQPLFDLEESSSSPQATYQDVPVRAPVLNHPRILKKSYEALVETVPECSGPNDPGAQTLSLRRGGDLDRQQPPRSAPDFDLLEARLDRLCTNEPDPELEAEAKRLEELSKRQAGVWDEETEKVMKEIKESEEKASANKGGQMGTIPIGCFGERK